MLRRFLVFTLSLLALFSLAALTQDRLPEPYRIFPTFAQLLPSDPLRSLTKMKKCVVKTYERVFKKQEKGHNIL